MAFTLHADVRTERGKKLDQLRTQGKIPAIMYGPKEKPTPLTVDRAQFEKLFKITGESSVITLDGFGGSKEVLVHDVAFDPRRGGIMHVDFYVLEAGKEVTVDIPLQFIGEAPALKIGGTLTKVLHEVKVSCTPNNLPKEIIVDTGVLDTFDAQIHVRDLTIPQGVRVLNDGNDVVALIQTVSEEEEQSAPIDMSTIEVAKKGKAEEAE